MLGKDSTDLILQGKFVELANLKAEYAKKNVKVLEYVIKHFGSFIPGVPIPTTTVISDTMRFSIMRLQFLLLQADSML